MNDFIHHYPCRVQVYQLDQQTDGPAVPSDTPAEERVVNGRLEREAVEAEFAEKYPGGYVVHVPAD